MKQYEIVDTPIDITAYHRYAVNRNQGAVCMFTGHVREWTKGVRTVHLEYEAYKRMAEQQLARIGEEIAEQWPGVITTIVAGVGKVERTDIALANGSRAPHLRSS